MRKFSKTYPGLSFIEDVLLNFQASFGRWVAISFVSCFANKLKLGKYYRILLLGQKLSIILNNNKGHKENKFDLIYLWLLNLSKILFNNFQ